MSQEPQFDRIYTFGEFTRDLARGTLRKAWRGIGYRSEFYQNLHGDACREQYLSRLGLSEAQRKAIDFKVIVPR